MSPSEMERICALCEGLLELKNEPDFLMAIGGAVILITVVAIIIAITMPILKSGSKKEEK